MSAHRLVVIAGVVLRLVPEYVAPVDREVLPGVAICEHPFVELPTLDGNVDQQPTEAISMVGLRVRGDPLLHVEATETLIESMEQLESHLKSFCVTDEAYRNYVVEAMEKMLPAEPTSWSKSDPRMRVQAQLEFSTEFSEYVGALVGHPPDATEFDEYVASYGDFILGSVLDVVTVVASSVLQMEHYEQFASEGVDFQAHIDSFEPSPETRYSFIEAESQVIKELSA